MLSKSEAIVLHSIKYGESKIIVDIFTRQQGRMAFVVNLPRTPRSKIKKQYFQPLTLLNIEYDVRPQAQLQKLSDVSLLTPLTSIQCEPSKLSIALFMAEFLYHALKGEQQNESLFDYLLSSILWLDGRKEQYANFHLVCLMRMTRFLGFFPNLEDYKEGDYFDLRASVFCSNPPLHHDLLLPLEAAQMLNIMRMDYATMHLFHMSHEERNRCLDFILTYYRLHLPDFPELRSWNVLRELYT